MKPATIKYLHSAGGVIFRKISSASHADFEVALIATKNKTIWTLPKGIIDKGESPEATAMREIEEETGLTGKIIEKLGEKSYWFYQKDENIKCRKTVTYFLLEYTGGIINSNCWEIDEARWFEIGYALKHLSYKSDRDILKMAQERLLNK